jgi:DtxR family Mn-dependent transcriptional regulator
MTIETLTPTLEDYLEVIFNIIATSKVARSMEIADKLNVKRSTVTVALRSLADKGLINYEPRSFITLTEEGKRIAHCIDKRHHILRDAFVEVFGLQENEAEKAACKMEHGMSTRLCQKITSLLQTIREDKALAQKLKAKMVQSEDGSLCEKSCLNAQHRSGARDGDDSAQSDLNLIKPGKSGFITRILGKSDLKRRLYEMGITTGQKITVVKAAPLDDPIEIKVRNYNLSLRREEAANILVEPE